MKPNEIRYFLVRDVDGEACFLFFAFVPNNAERVTIFDNDLTYTGKPEKTQYGIITAEYNIGKIATKSFLRQYEIDCRCEEITKAQFETYQEIAKLPIAPVEYCTPYYLSVDPLYP